MVPLRKLLLLFLVALASAGSVAYGDEDGEKSNKRPILRSPTGVDYTPPDKDVLLPDSYRCVQGGQCKLSDFLHSICALVVLENSRVVYDYFNPATTSGCTEQGMGVETTFGVASIAKSITSTLLGLAIADGRYGTIDLDKPLDDLQPGFSDIPGALSLRHVLYMRGGLREDDSGQAHHEEFRKVTLVNPGQGTMIFLDAINDLATPDPWAKPGKTFLYSNMTAASIGTALEAVLKRVPDGPKTLDTALKAWIWDPVGMAGDAAWKADKENSPSPYCCFYVRAYDLAKFGNYVLTQLNAPEARLHDWLKGATRYDGRSVRDPCFATGERFRLGYGYQWWTFEEKHLGFAAVGSKGQFLHVFPDDGLVIVQFSKNNDKGEKYRRFQCNSWSVHATIRKALAQ
jgi:CubicO group peptidase (beta-lactamase class C family)